MNLSNLEIQATTLMMPPVLFSEAEFANRLHIDEIDNFIDSLQDGLPDKYKKEWSQVRQMPVNDSDPIKKNSQSNQQVLAAHELMRKIRKWIESLGEYRDSPSFRSGQLNSVFDKEIPALLEEGKERKFITENACNFLDKLCDEFPPYTHKLSAFKKEFKRASKWRHGNRKFGEWCKRFSIRITVYFDNYCLEDEWAWHVARLNGKHFYDTAKADAISKIDTKKRVHKHSMWTKVISLIKKPYSLVSAVVIGLAALTKAIYEITTNIDRILNFLGL
jgi:hypothetical protein